MKHNVYMFIEPKRHPRNIKWKANRLMYLWAASAYDPIRFVAKKLDTEEHALVADDRVYCMALVSSIDAPFKLDATGKWNGLFVENYVT